MAHQLHVTLGSGDVREIPFEQHSVLLVRTRSRDAFNTIVDTEDAVTDVVDVQFVEVDDEPLPVATIVQESPYLSTPEVAARVAKEMPASDGAALLEQALAKWPGDEQILEAQEQVAAKLAGVEPAPPVEPETPEQPEVEPVAHDDAVASVQASVEAIASATSSDHEAELIAKATADVDEALVAYPDSPQLQDAKAQLAGLASPPAV